MAASTSEPSASGEIDVCSESFLREQHRHVVPVEDREVVLFHLGERGIYALDKHCYHGGGPLEMGQLTEIEDVPCVVCPWHKYILSLKTGEGFYQSIDPHNLKKPPAWQSKGLKQRTHHVEVHNGRVILTLSDLNNKVESDYYYSQEYKDNMCIKVPQLPKKS